MKGFQPGDPRAVAAGKRGGAVSGHKRWRRALAEIRAVWPGMPPEAAVAIHSYVARRVASALSGRARKARAAAS